MNAEMILQKKYYFLGEKGLEVTEKGLPERRLALLIKEHGKVKVERARLLLKMDRREFNAALGRAIKRGWVSLIKEDGSFLIPKSN